MLKTWSVVVGIDFSESSDRALEVAMAVSTSAGAPLELVHVWNTHRVFGSEEPSPDVEYWFRDQKDRIARRLREKVTKLQDSGLSTTCRVVEGVPSQMLPKIARSNRAGLLVVGRRGAASLPHVLLGSVSERVTYLADCPVLIVPKETISVECPNRLIVGIDFSDASNAAYRAALDLADRMRIPQGLVLIHTRPGERDLYDQDSTELTYEKMYPSLSSDLEREANTPERNGIEVNTQVVQGPTPQTILGAAEAHACDWIVVGVQGRTALAALMMGGSTDRILKLADRPVLVVPMSSREPEEASN